MARLQNGCPFASLVANYYRMFNKITCFNNLLSAYFRTRKNKRFKPEVQKAEINFENRLINLQGALRNFTYRPQKYRRFLVHEPKLRQVSAPAFIDRVVHQAIVAVIEPIFDKQFIPNSFACRKEKGTRFGMFQIAQCYQEMRTKQPIFYALKCDIKSYFASIDQEILISFLNKSIPSQITMNLLKTIISSYYDSPGKGIPIGNLTSQLFANIYLHPLDLYVTQILGEKNYFRYMDDFLILSPDKEYLKRLREEIRLFLTQTLKLELHPKKANIFRADRGLDFVGYLIKNNEITLRKKTLRRYKRRHKKRLKQLEQCKNILKRITNFNQLSLFDRSNLSKNLEDNPEVEKLQEQIKDLQQKLRSSRNSFKGFLNCTQYKRLEDGAVKIGNIVVPKIFPKKKDKLKSI